jgi:hypothetical protein
MTMWANIVHGLGYGWTGIIISGWPPVALIAAVKVLARMIRPSPTPEMRTAVHEPPAALNGHVAEAVERFADDIAAGAVRVVRRIRREMHVC